MTRLKLLLNEFGVDYIKDTIRQSISYNETLKKLNCGASKCFYELKDIIKQYQIDISHFLGRGRVSKNRCRFIDQLEDIGPVIVNEILQKVDCPSQAIYLIGKSSLGGEDCQILKNFANKYNLNTSHWLDLPILLSKRFKGGYKEIYGSMWGQYQRHAETRNLLFNISIEQAWQQFLEQDRKCALSGILLTFQTQCRKRDGTASLDRINSTRGYEVDNIQWIHKELQKVKMNMSDERLITWCKIIAAYN